MGKEKLLALVAMMGLMGDGFPMVIKQDETPRQRESRISLFKVKQNIDRGLKPFEIEGQTIWALNYKNALKKVKKKLQSAK